MCEQTRYRFEKKKADKVLAELPAWWLRGMTITHAELQPLEWGERTKVVSSDMDA